ncbi:hypothetical protein PROFUN_17119, partial [Planoprotostelium fungivorum]
QPHNEQPASTTHLPYYYDIYHSYECSTYNVSAPLLLCPTATMKCRMARDKTTFALLYLIKRQQSALLSSLSRVNEIEERL